MMANVSAGVPLGSGGVHIRVRVGERADGVERALACGVHQGRPAAAWQDGLTDVGIPFLERVADDTGRRMRIRRHPRPRVDIRAGGRQRTNSIAVVLERGPHQRGRAGPGLDGVDACALRDERVDDREAAGPRREHQHRASFGQLRVGGFRAGAGSDEQFDHALVAVAGGQRQRRHAIAVRRVHVRAGFDERFDCSDRLIGADCAMQIRRAIRRGNGRGKHDDE
jgi:hypothetical protein